MGSLLANENLLVERGSHVQLRYKLKSEGKVVFSSAKQGLIEFDLNEGQLWPAFEKNILAMRVGEKKIFELLPEDAFGLWDSKNERVLQRSQLQLPKKKLKPGMTLTATNPMTSETWTGRVTKIIENQVRLDFNHPLAGKTLQVEVKILEIR